MIKYIFSAIFITVMASINANADHRSGTSGACWRDSGYSGNGWAYYFCGDQSLYCSGKKAKGHDTVFWQYNGDSFTFEDGDGPYYCCGGSKSGMGLYKRSNSWIIDRKTEKKPVEGGTCNKLIETDVCGGKHVTECTEPDNCNPGLILRNKECIKPCGEDEVFEDPTSNTCINCETTLYQGIVTKTERKGSITNQYKACEKCDKDTEFYDKYNKICVKKQSLINVTHSTIKACWRCPNEYFKDCVKEMNKPADQRGFAINNWELIKNKCFLE